MKNLDKMKNLENIKGITKKLSLKKNEHFEDDFDLSSFGNYINSFESVGKSFHNVDYREDALKSVSFRKP
ncbi:hypothetical protein M23134_01088 [Microscilla marina ATCC 23134]|uniref:Uncharacterized protein n=2 Tax=Microscilla marina TaxID=1027 RepID=A1ZFJ0_MICM2|nr:hypothetical protein M23134_01088 [Microscilla marina ATCC 23134]